MAFIYIIGQDIHHGVILYKYINYILSAVSKGYRLEIFHYFFFILNGNVNAAGQRYIPKDISIAVQGGKMKPVFLHMVI